VNSFTKYRDLTNILLSWETLFSIVGV